MELPNIGETMTGARTDKPKKTASKRTMITK